MFTNVETFSKTPNTGFHSSSFIVDRVRPGARTALTRGEGSACVCAPRSTDRCGARREARVRLERRHTTRWRIVAHSDHINAIACPLQRGFPYSVVESSIALSHCAILALPRRYGSGAKVSRTVLFLDDEVTAARLVSSRFVPPRFI